MNRRQSFIHAASALVAGAVVPAKPSPPSLLVNEKFLSREEMFAKAISLLRQFRPADIKEAIKAHREIDAATSRYMDGYRLKSYHANTVTKDDGTRETTIKEVWEPRKPQ